MLKLHKASRLVAGAVLSAVAASSAVAPASAQSVAALVLGPPRLGSAVTYRLTVVSGDPATTPPDVQTLALRWKLADKVLATVTNPAKGQSTPYVATRAADGTFALDNANPEDTEGQRLASAIGLMNRITGFVAGAPSGAGTWNTTLVVQPPNDNAPAGLNSKKPQALTVPLSAERSSVSDGTTLTASGSAARDVTRPAAEGSGRGVRPAMGGRRREGLLGGGYPSGGDMGGPGVGIGMGGAPPKTSTVTTKIAVSAHFGVDGVLSSGTIVETISGSDDQTAASTRSWEVDRTP
jgi:hypothetical protein